jgi:DNA-binding response OmpR family regulator
MVRNDPSHFNETDYDHSSKLGHRQMIMIVEDDALVGGALERALKCAGHGAVVIPSGMEALSLMHLQMPKMMIIDLGLPGLDGMSLLRSVRKDHAYDGMPIVVYSAEFGSLVQRDAMAAGAQDYIVKGTMGIESFIGRVERLLKDREPRLRISQ